MRNQYFWPLTMELNEPARLVLAPIGFQSSTAASAARSYKYVLAHTSVYNSRPRCRNVRSASKTTRETTLNGLAEGIAKTVPTGLPPAIPMNLCVPETATRQNFYKRSAENDFLDEESPNLDVENDFPLSVQRQPRQGSLLP
jgi:hypothetical protein